MKNRRRRLLVSQPLPAQLLKHIQRNLWQFVYLNAAQQTQVQNTARVMAAEIAWEGIDDFVVDEEVKLTISATASLLTLGLDEPFYFDGVRSILVHASAIANQPLRQGYIVDHDQVFTGQAWQGGPLIFAWPAVLSGSRFAGDGHNVVIHEFAHHIDGLDGEMGGMPYIPSPQTRRQWQLTLTRDYQYLKELTRQGRRTPIDPYAATNQAEFFAVTVECFFDAPSRLHQAFPELFDLYVQYFNLDPRKLIN